MELAPPRAMYSLDDALDTRATHSPQQPIESSLIDLVLAATEFSEDESEINDGIAALIQSGAVAILPRDRDLMQRRAAKTAPPTPLPALYPPAT